MSKQFPCFLASWAIIVLLSLQVQVPASGAEDEGFTLDSTVQPATSERPLRLWYGEPAGKWEEALPLGNGRMGAMVFGSAPRELLQLNEESLWAGEPEDVYPENFAANLRGVQQLVLQGKIAEARTLGLETLTKSPTSYRSFEPLADLSIELDHASDVQDYRRELDLETGLLRVAYRSGGVHWRREMFISAVNDVLAVRLTGDRPGVLRARIQLTRKKDMHVTAVADHRLRMDGQIVDVAGPEAHDDNPGGSGAGGEHMRFAGRLLVQTVGGTVKPDGQSLVIDSADEAVLLMTAATDFNLERMTFDRSIDPGAEADAILERAAQRSWSELLRDHVAEHRSHMNRVALDLGGSDRDGQPTDQRLSLVKRGEDDPGLNALYFQYGRYLLMSSSRRPGRVPANLQGIWSRRIWAPWEADYHLNINLQMNYWPADLCNLSETVDPLADWFSRVTEKGRVSAERLYGARGWVAFTTVNLFGRTTPGGSNKGSQFQNGVLDPLAGAWMAMTLWRHYEFTGDREFLRKRAYPILKGAAEFLADYLIEDSKGHLVIVPSTSPENAYVQPETGKAVRITYASTYHMAIVRAVLDAVIQGSLILEQDDSLREELQAILAKLPPVQIGKDGTIQEWIKDYKESAPGHRHVSHLIGLHPFTQITEGDRDLFEAAGKTIERRLAHGGGHTGWSRAWIINFYARLQDGDSAHRHVQQLLQKSTLPNLFDTHPPFQIDGNFGGCAGIAEMLLQSHGGVVHVLPALPKAWNAGSVRGLRARGGFVVDIAWREGKVVSSEVRATRDAVLRLRIGDQTTERSMKAGEVLRPVEQRETIHVLIVDGFSNHDWHQTTRLVRRILDCAGGFDVTVSTSPPTAEAAGWDTWRPCFADFDVVIQNCNSIGKRPTWPREVEVALESYVLEGGGLYILHSANNAFAHWEQYDRMIGLGWRGADGGTALTVEDGGGITRIPPGEGRGTYHGPRVDTVIHVLGPHPIHQGFPNRWKTPMLEVYKYARGPAEDLTVLSYGYDPDTEKNWPLEWTVQYGKGSVYNSTFGHVWRGDDNPVSMRCVGFQTTLIRALQWLATGKVTYPLPDRFPTENETVVCEP